MSSLIAIRAEGVSKRYKLAQQKGRHFAKTHTLSEKIQHAIGSPAKWLRGLKNGDGAKEDFWALKDVTFEVRQGEVLGIIGRNGAGKSTLLKVLSRITEPTTGEVRLRGRVASLLEVGTGFHPELSGRENVFLNGAILGMSRVEIRSRFDEIVEFAGVSKFLDTPVKHYSSGMYVRLAFAVAAHLRTDILIVDEVLAVGDMEFQKKCLGKMSEVTKDGRTVLFVSHNIGAVSSLCTHALFLRQGQLVQQGNVDEAIRAYLSSASACGAASEFSATDKNAGDEFIRVTAARLMDTKGECRNNFNIDEEVWIEVDHGVTSLKHSPRINVHLLTDDGSHAFASIETNEVRELGARRSRLRIPPHLLNGRTYFVTVYATSFRPTKVHAELRDILVLNVIDRMDVVTRQGYEGSFPGVTRPNLEWDVAAL